MMEGRSKMPLHHLVPSQRNLPDCPWDPPVPRRTASTASTAIDWHTFSVCAPRKQIEVQEQVDKVQCPDAGHFAISSEANRRTGVRLDPVIATSIPYNRLAQFLEFLRRRPTGAQMNTGIWEMWGTTRGIRVVGAWGPRTWRLTLKPSVWVTRDLFCTYY